MNNQIRRTFGAIKSRKEKLAEGKSGREIELKNQIIFRVVVIYNIQYIISFIILSLPLL